MKVIVSHDVDHLFARDHWFRDLIYPKMWVRTTIQRIKGEITGKEWWLRTTSCVRKNRHNLEPLMQFDKEHGIPSTFFFGMNQGLGMSYKPHEAAPIVRMVHNNGFSVGVHGIDYQDSNRMREEYELFKAVTGIEPDGIRMHYVRFDSETFLKLSAIGYCFDSTEFDKTNGGTIKNPYKVGPMWEFPLAIMDAYLPQTFEEAKKRTLKRLAECDEAGVQYITVLFHDFQFCDDYQDMKKWYEWLIEYCAEVKEYSFASYEQAMEEMNRRL